MHVLVTGAGGFVGKTVSKKLQKNGHRVLGIIRQNKCEDDIFFLQRDLSLPWDIDEKVDVILHIAGALPYQSEDFSVFYRDNVVVMDRLLQFAVKNNVRRVIYLSTIGVYGDIHKEIVTEETDIINPSFYGMTKYVAECMLRSEIGVRSVSLRLPGIIGKGCRRTWMSNTLFKLQNNERLEIYAPDFLTNSFVWIEDLSQYICKLIDMQDWKYNILNLSCREKNTIREIVLKMRKVTGSVSEIAVNNEIRKPFCIDVRKATEMGYNSLSPIEIVERYCKEERSD